MRRSLGLILMMVGLVATVVGVSSGCGSLFSFNGRHAIAAQALVPGTPLSQTVPAKSGRRYTLSVQVVFERDGLREANGVLVVEAKYPLIASVGDAKVTGWLDPDEPPNVLYGQGSNPRERRPVSVGPVELVVERLVGPYIEPFDQPLTYSVDLGLDRVGRARVHEARVVLYDDTLPIAITLAFAAAAGGLCALVAGTMLSVYGLMRKRRGGARRRPPV